MKRLTERSLDYCTQLCSDEDAISCAFYKGEQEEKCWRANMYDRLAYYEDLEEQGRLLVLPCKVGDRVWGVEFDTSECPHCFGFGGCYGCSGAKPKGVYYFKFRLQDAEKIGKTVFLTRAEAEKAMEVNRE